VKKIAFVVRGNLKDPDKFRANISRYFQNEYEVFLKFTRHGGHAVDIVEQLMEEWQPDYLVGVGGDGTFSEVVNGYMLAPAEIREKVILAAFPRGAGNDFARTAGKIESMEQLYQVVQSHETRMLDVVKVSYSENGVEKIRYYDNSFDIGLGGLVCKFVNSSGKKWGSNFTYFYNILRSFLLFKRIPVTLKSDEYEFQGKVLLIVLNNGRFFGSGLCVTPDAKLDDGKVNVLIARKINILQFLRYVPSLKHERKINHPEVFYAELSQCTIESPVKDCPIEIDGEVIGNVPLRIEVIKHAALIVKV